MIINAVTVLTAARTDMLNIIPALAAAPTLHALLSRTEWMSQAQNEPTNLPHEITYNVKSVF